MGGGRKFRPDVQKGPPRDPLRALLGGLNGVGEPEIDVATAYAFCEQPHQIDFRITSDVDPAAGAVAILVLGDPPSVVVDDRVVGIVDGNPAIAMRGCLELGYRMSGVIETVDAGTRRGTLEVKGVRKKVA